MAYELKKVVDGEGFGLVEKAETLKYPTDICGTWSIMTIKGIRDVLSFRVDNDCRTLMEISEREIDDCIAECGAYVYARYIFQVGGELFENIETEEEGPVLMDLLSQRPEIEKVFCLFNILEIGKNTPVMFKVDVSNIDKQLEATAP